MNKINKILLGIGASLAVLLPVASYAAADADLTNAITNVTTDFKSNALPGATTAILLGGLIVVLFAVAAYAFRRLRMATGR